MSVEKEMRRWIVGQTNILPIIYLIKVYYCNYSLFGVLVYHCFKVIEFVFDLL